MPADRSPLAAGSYGAEAVRGRGPDLQLSASRRLPYIDARTERGLFYARAEHELARELRPLIGPANAETMQLLRDWATSRLVQPERVELELRTDFFVATCVAQVISARSERWWREGVASLAAEPRDSCSAGDWGGSRFRTWLTGQCHEWVTGLAKPLDRFQRRASVD